MFRIIIDTKPEGRVSFSPGSTPYLLLSDYRIALAILFLSISIIVSIFTFFVSITKEISFRKMFLEMLLISLGVATVSFVIGWATRIIFGIEI